MTRARSWTVWAAFLAAGAAATAGCGGGGGAGTTNGSSSSSGGGGTTSHCGDTGVHCGTGGQGGGTGGHGGGTGGHGGAATGPFTSQGATSYEAQTSLAADGKGGVVAVWIGFFADNTSAIGYAVSRDGGVGWTAPVYVKSPGGRLASNPVVAVDGQGRFSLAWLGFRVAPSSTDEHVYLSRLDAATETFPDPVVASDDGTSTTRDFDKPSIAVDANDNVLLTWADFTGSGMSQSPSLTFARTTDGKTFTRSTIVADTGFGSLAYLCLDAALGPTAPLYVVHLGANGTLGLNTSSDQGQTWKPSSAVTGATGVVFQDPTCVAHGSDLWVAYASGSAMFVSGKDSPGDVVDVIHSPSGGSSFEAPVAVTSGSGTQYLFPQIVRDPSGKLEVVYYQGTDGAAATLTRAASTTGATWTTVSIASPGNFTLDRTLASWLGDYLGAAAAGGQSFVSYTENTQGKAHVAFIKVASP